jgi:hypothetical protein
MRPQVKTIGLVLGVLALSAGAAEAKHYYKHHYRHGHYVSHGSQHCGQQSYSVSVGNPAFKHRLARWPAPCGM